MQIFAMAALGLAIVASPAAAATPALAKPITDFINAFNKGDVKGAAAAHDADVNIVDEVPPFEWHGKKAFESWVADLDKHDTAAGVTGQKVTIGAATREVVGGDKAYVVVPAVYSFTQKGVAMREPAQFTFLLKKGLGGWKISGWTWTGPDPKPVK